jgi:hypothetical protein
MGVESAREAGILPTEVLPLSQRPKYSMDSRLRASPKSPLPWESQILPLTITLLILNGKAP